MVEYNIVKHCGLCKKRFVVNKSESKNNFCNDCQSKFYNERNKEVNK